MRFDKFTTKFQEALSDAQSIALGHDNAYIEPVHMLVAMLRQDEGPRALLERAGANVPGLLKAAEAAVKRLPQVQGQDQVQGSPELGRVLQATEKEAIQRGDQFIASELFLLALIDSKGEAAQIAKDNGLSRKSLEAAIEAVRGGQKVDSAEAEGQREALKKYCLDLTERARMSGSSASPHRWLRAKREEARETEREHHGDIPRAPHDEVTRQDGHAKQPVCARDGATHPHEGVSERGCAVGSSHTPLAVSERLAKGQVRGTIRTLSYIARGGTNYGFLRT